MRISVEIEQIDNGFTVSMFDADGEEEHDQNLFVDNLEEVLKIVGKWADDIVEREANGEEADK